MKILHSISSAVYFAVLSVRCRMYREEDSSICVNGVNLYYAMRGPADGKPVVLIHGNGGSHRSMRTQAMQLALAGYRVYSPDSRGQGANEELQEYHYDDMAEDTFHFINDLKLDKPALYGWSDGGIIALLLEMKHPGTCSLIALSGANLCPDCGPGFEEFKKWILEQGTPLAMMMLNEPDIDPSELEAIKCPALVTVGEKELISVEHTEMIASSIPDSELVVFKEASHSSYIKRSPKMGRVLLDYLKRHNY